MLKGLASDLTGSSDITHVVRDLTTALGAAYLLPQEQIIFVLQSSKEEHCFTNQALLRIKSGNATTTCKLITRFEFKTNIVSCAELETAGRVDRNCELRFHIGSEEISIAIAKAEASAACEYFKVLVLLGRAQEKSEREWEMAQMALERSAMATQLAENTGVTLTGQADAAADWLFATYERTHPHCYKDVIMSALNDVRSIAKTEPTPQQPNRASRRGSTFAGLLEVVSFVT